MSFRRNLLPALCLLVCSVGLRGQVAGDSASVFDVNEIRVLPSPSEPRRLNFPSAEKPVDFDVSAAGPAVAILVHDAAGAYRVVFWDINAPEKHLEWPVPTGIAPRSIAWHPASRVFFLAGSSRDEFAVWSVKEASDGWSAQEIHRSAHEIRRLVLAPRPFTSQDEGPFYRLFFGEKGNDGSYAIKSVTEQGGREYQVVGPKSGFMKLPEGEMPPSEIEARWALPVAFHPTGHLLIWEDDTHCFNVARYDHVNWGKSAPLLEGKLCGGSVTATPNGVGLLYWRPGTPGATLYLDGGAAQSVQAAGETFISTPSSVPDGKGIVGLTKTSEGWALVYVPIAVPLADVANAWMFAGSAAERRLFAANGGLFRDLEDDQLYSLYDSEAYSCGGYEPTTPKRPYLVTTDIFWEIFAAAYEGMFILRERQEAIPAFWEFVKQADRALQTSHPGSRWAGIFSSVNKLQQPGAGKETEVARILRAEGRVFSPLLGREFDYGELKPRGHYTSRPDLETYFKAFHYLTEVTEKNEDVEELKSLPADVKAKALAWIRPYESFIAPPRAPLVWKDDKFSPPPYAKHPAKERVFPLSWGFDNEVLLSTVYHLDWPEPEQIKSSDGLPRLLPSSLDVAAALGSGLARMLLAEHLRKYPRLVTALERLQMRSPAASGVQAASGSLYDRWLAALAVQWSEEVAPPNTAAGEKLWRAKRLQTGLASWATLRHATVLVNERTGAECGEGGFEAIIMAPPRGYVEADPQTFGAIAELFDAAARELQSAAGSFQGNLKVEESNESEPVRQGILRRLAETAKKARLFQAIAAKELRGEPLTNQEYEEILYVGRIAEHHFLVFKSLAREDFALSNPDPIPKIADVSGGGPYHLPYLEAGVGHPMEWDQIVPYFGRREIAKGSVYSYYEFVSDRLLNDAEWRQKLPAQPHPDWIASFLAGSTLPCPAHDPY